MPEQKTSIDASKKAQEFFNIKAAFYRKTNTDSFTKKAFDKRRRRDVNNNKDSESKMIDVGLNAT